MYTQWVFLKGNLKFLKGELFRVEGPIKKQISSSSPTKQQKWKKKKISKEQTAAKELKINKI